MVSALGSIQTPEAKPDLEPGICHHCGAITDIPVGVQFVCTRHEEKSQVLTTRHLFGLLGQITGLNNEANPEGKAMWDLTLQRMRELQAHILPEDQVVTAGPPGH